MTNVDGDEGEDQNLRIRSAIPIALAVLLAIGGLILVTSYVTRNQDGRSREVPIPPAAMAVPLVNPGPLATQPLGGDGVIQSMRFDTGIATVAVLDTTQWQVGDPVLVTNPGGNAIMTRGLVKDVLPPRSRVQIELAPMSNGGWPPLIGHVVQRTGDAATRPSSAATQPTTSPAE